MPTKKELKAALQAVKKQPTDEALWDDLERIAAALDAPDEVAALYRDVLAGELPPATILTLGERAAQFHEEWYSDDPSGLIKVLERMIEADPTSHSAFQRLTVAYTVAQRWDDLLGLYDRTIEAATDRTRQIHLLEEAAQVAKDVTGQAEKAIGYLQRLRGVQTGDDRLAQNLERLLERHEKWRDLIALWESQLDDQEPRHRVRTRLRIATCWMDNLADPARALEAARPLLAEAEDDRDACALLERIVQSDAAPAAARAGALDLLRAHYGATGRPREIVRVLRTAIERARGAELEKLHEEAGARLAELNDDAAAMDHYAALLALNPGSSVTQEQLRQLAGRSSDWERYARGVAAAADAARDVPRKIALLTEAARTRLDRLGDETGSIELLKTALAQEGISDDDVRPVARRLSELLANTDRTAERLDVLERLAGVETGDSRRRATLGDAARLAESLGEIDRALAAWQRRLDVDPADRVALDGVVALDEKTGRWQPLIKALDARVAHSDSARDRHSDLVRIATVWEHELDDADRAIDAWVRVQKEHGDDAESIDALTGLYARTGRYREMADMLGRVSAGEIGRITRRLITLGNALRDQLGDPAGALACYRQVLTLDATDPTALDGLAGLLADPAFRGRAADALAVAYRSTKDWRKFLDLVEPRLADAGDPQVRLQILREAAEIHERELGEAGAALEALARALPLAVRDRALAGELHRLARATGTWAPVVQAHRGAAQAGADDPREVAHHKLTEAQVLERELGSADDAFGAYALVAGLEPDRLEAVEAVVRLGSRAGRWDDAARAAVGYLAHRKLWEPSLFDEMDRAAGDRGGWDDLTRAVSDAADKAAATVPARVGFELWHRVSRWHRDRRDDSAAAEQALVRALACDGTRLDALRELDALQQKVPGAAYYDTLMRIADSDPADLDVLREAAAVAADVLEDPARARAAATALLGRASSAWRGSAPGRTEQSPQALVSWALGALVDDHLRGGNHGAAIDLLIDASRLPFDEDTRRSMRVRAAGIAADSGDTAAAMEMYRSVLAMNPADADTMHKLGALYQAAGKIPELLSLRRHELELSQDRDRRLELRLEIAHLVGEVERLAGRLQALRANLDESPGHDASIEALCTILDATSQHAALADMLEDQAARLEKGDQGERAARLWNRVAGVAEHQLEDVDRAIEAYRRVVAIRVDVPAFDALARLFVHKKQPAQAVPWLERSLQAGPAGRRGEIVLQLAEAHLAAAQREQAIGALEQYLADDLPALEQRTQLADLYRQAGSWEPLARLLTRSLPMLGDDQTRMAYAREAATIWVDRLGAPDKAIPALEQALKLSPDDKALQVQLATGLRVAGRTRDARRILDKLIEAFGRRKSAERANVHVELAMVAKAEDKSDEALEQLEMASKMDASNPRILKMVADLYLVNGKPDEAERTYRALLLVVRRQPPGDDLDAVGASEVLFELHMIAAGRGDAEPAKELLESALEAAMQSDAEVRRLRRSLLAHDQYEVLLKALRLRLQQTEKNDSRASLLTDIAQVLDDKLQRPGEALEAQLEAIALIPDRLELHDSARELARKAGQIDRYVAAVDKTVDSLRRKKDAPIVATLLMKAGQATEEDVGDLRRALTIYKRVEGSGERTAEALFAIARVTGQLGENRERARALDALLELATGAEESPAKTDALYRVAEMFASDDERRLRGIELLEEAFAADPRHAQAGGILRTAAEAEPESGRVMKLYERVARGAGDWQMLLDFLERRARLPGATPNEVKEAVDLAAEHGLEERGRALLDRAVIAARGSDEGISAAVWAVVALAELRASTGHFEEARDLLLELADAGENDRVIELGIDIAGKAASRDDSRELATEIYEMLRQREPSNRRIWEPLVELYRALGLADRLQATIAGTLPTLVERGERNALRMQHVNYLLEIANRPDAAAEVLRDVLLDDPDHLDAAARLEEVLREAGDSAGQADFLWQRFEEARARNNADSIVDVAGRLGSLLDAMLSPEAASVYRTALESVPDSRELLRAVIAHLDAGADPTERAQLNERLLAVEDEELVPALTTEVAAMWESLGDDDGVRRSLATGFRRCPGDPVIHDRLEKYYRDRELWQPLAAMMVDDAAHLAERSPDRAVTRLREAAVIHIDQLGNPAAAAGVLTRARELAPADDQLLGDLVASLVAAGEQSQAIDALTEALAGDFAGAGRVNLLLTRSDLYAGSGRTAESVADLEEAYQLDRELAGPLLLQGLDTHRIASVDRGDFEGERAATLRLGELLLASGDAATARQLMTAWVDRAPGDRDALIFLRDLDTEAGDWEGVIAVCDRLVQVDGGADQIDAALRLADAAEKADRAEAARPGLEQVHAAQPEAVIIRDRLRRIYELSGAHRELAALLVADGDHAEDPDARYQAYRRAAELYLGLEDPAAAAGPAEQARALRPEDHDSSMLVVDVLIASGNVLRAAEILDDAINGHKKRSPELAVLQQRMARVTAAKGDREGQLDWLKKAFDVDRKNAEIAAELAHLATEVGDYELALKPLRAITLMENPGPVTRVMALLWEAKIEHARGNHAKAELWAKKALREDPSYAEAQEFLQQITS